MTKTFLMKLEEIQPTQLCISSEKLDNIMGSLERCKPISIESIPVKKTGNKIVSKGGYTRAFAAFLFGLSEMPVYWEDEELDWDACEICVRRCSEEGIHTIMDQGQDCLPKGI